MIIVSTEQSERIHRLCYQYDIFDYRINDDGSIDVQGDVNFVRRNPGGILVLDFNVVYGSFDCSQNNITSFIGAPKLVTGNFNCSFSKLTSLEYSPIRVDGNFICLGNRLTNLIGSPFEVGGYFSCNRNLLTSLEGCPNVIGDDFDCRHNEISSFASYPEEVGGNLYCIDNNLPTELDLLLRHLSLEERVIFLKYQKYYEVWLPEFNIDGMNELVAEIRDGLR
jgi:hypothetical protein